jgi:hypothetical protein
MAKAASRQVETLVLAPSRPRSQRRTSRRATEEARAPLPYLSPYLAGVGIGLVLLLAFVVMGAGLGASGAFTTVIGAGMSAVSPETTQRNAFFGSFAPGPDMRPIDYWLLVEIVGVSIGALLSGYSARRIRVVVERGDRIGDRSRLVLAFAGGAIMGFGAMLARGCTAVRA